MKLKLIKPIDFRIDKFQAGDVVEIPEGLAQKLILDGIAIKASALDLVAKEDEVLEDEVLEDEVLEKPKKKGKK